MTKKFKNLLWLLPLTLIACAGVDSSNLAREKWKPVFIDGTSEAHKARAKGVEAFVEFSNGSINGLAGDNLFRGVFEIDDEGRVANRKISKTNLSGLNAGYEKAFLSAINNADYVDVSSDKVSLYDNEGKILMQLAPLNSVEAYVAELEQEEIVEKIEEISATQEEQEALLAEQERIEKEKLEQEKIAQAKLAEEKAKQDALAKLEAEKQAEALAQAKAKRQAEELQRQAKLKAQNEAELARKAEKAKEQEKLNEFVEQEEKRLSEEKNAKAATSLEELF